MMTAEEYLVIRALAPGEAPEHWKALSIKERLRYLEMTKYKWTREESKAFYTAYWRTLGVPEE